MADEDLFILMGRSRCAAAHAGCDDGGDDAEDDEDDGEFEEGEDPPAEQFARERHVGGIGGRAGGLERGAIMFGMARRGLALDWCETAKRR